MTAPLKILSSMATRQVLADLAAGYEARASRKVALESVGGVDAAKRVRAGESFDAVVLASDAIDKLELDGHVVVGSRIDLVRSETAIAVRAGASHPDIASEEAVKRAVRSAKSLSYSTGPSGVHLARLFERWGIAAEVAPKIVQAPPGVPVGSLVADGKAELGFQQLAELIHLSGIDVVGPLPPGAQRVTIFSAGVVAGAKQPDAARRLIAYLSSAAAGPAIRKSGMEPVQKANSIGGLTPTVRRHALRYAH